MNTAHVELSSFELTKFDHLWSHCHIKAIDAPLSVWPADWEQNFTLAQKIYFMHN